MPIDAPRSVLIVRLSAIGDVVHALPVLDALRRALPKARIGWIVEELSAPLLENHPQLDRLYVIPKKRWKADFRGMFAKEIQPFFAAVKADGWDAAIDLQGLTKSGLVSWASGAPRRVGFAGESSREINALFANRRIAPGASDVHVVQRNLSLLRGLGIEPSADAAGTIGLRDEEKAAMRAKLRDAGWDGAAPLLALNPGAGWASKLWPTERFAETGARLHRERGMVPLIVWGPKEEPLRDAIARDLERDGIPFVVAPPTRIRELAVLISLCSGFVGGDTGPTHLAGLLRVPTVSVFGASDGRRNRPWPLEGTALVQRTDLACVPCWKTECPLKGDAFMACLRGLEAERVAAAFGSTARS